MFSILLVLALAAGSDDFDWHKRADRAAIDGALNNLATGCARDFGFTRQPRLPADTMVDKLEAHLLLEPSPDYRLSQWADLMERWGSLDEAGKDETMINRLVDAAFAAAKDPDVYADAEKLYVNTFIAPVNKAMDGCTRAARDPFVSKYYVTGAGSSERWTEKMKQSFAKMVAETREGLK